MKAEEEEEGGREAKGKDPSVRSEGGGPQARQRISQIKGQRWSSIMFPCSP